MNRICRELAMQELDCPNKDDDLRSFTPAGKEGGYSARKYEITNFLVNIFLHKNRMSQFYSLFIKHRTEFSLKILVCAHFIVSD